MNFILKSNTTDVTIPVQYDSITSSFIFTIQPEEVSSFSFRFTSIPSGAYGSINPSKLTLAAGEEAIVTVTVTSPIGIASSDRYMYTLNASPEGYDYQRRALTYSQVMNVTKKKDVVEQTYTALSSEDSELSQLARTMAKEAAKKAALRYGGVKV